jgi:radical SAM superfamily enzyme YgiQ (UPF0313 family)
LRKVRSEPGVRKAFIASGIRYDLANRSPDFVRELATHHTGGQLSVAPEHNDEGVLDKMKKPPIAHYERFARSFCQASEAAGKQQFLIPYLITGHPGSGVSDTIELSLYLKRNDMRPRQIQDFIPTPMAMATAMYYSGYDPISLEPVATVRSLREKRQMKALVLYWDRAHWPLAREALKSAGRSDLIGLGPECLVPPGRAGEMQATRTPGPPSRTPTGGPSWPARGPSPRATRGRSGTRSPAARARKPRPGYPDRRS